MASSQPLRVTTGTLAFDGGVNSSITPYQMSEVTPRGLKPNQLSWMDNCTVRGGGITCRTGFTKLATLPVTGIYQGSYIYQPDSGLPYHIVVISGQFYKVDTGGDNSVTAMPYGFAQMSATAERFWMCQAECFLVVQDGINNPMVWNGTNWAHSATYYTPPDDPYTSTIPTGTAMDYYLGRLWIANGRQYVGSDLIGNTASGTAAWNYRDAVLRMTENAYLDGGGTFTVPTNAGNITAIRHSANIDINLGDDSLFIFTKTAVYTITVPYDRTQWQNFTANTLPVQRIAQIRYGTSSDRAVVRINGDVFYQSPDGVRSIKMASKDFQTWDNTPISNNELRVLQYNDQSLMGFASAVEFDQRLLVTCLPIQTDVGVAFQGIMPLDLDGIGTLEEKMPPAWEGILEGLDFLEITEGDYGGVQRAFAVIKSRISGDIELWEITNYLRRDNGDNRITWFFETCSYNWGSAFDKKKLDGMRLWVDKLYGTVDFTVYYRPDQHPCWTLWGQWQECAARDECEDLDPPIPCEYPEQIYREQYRIPMTLGAPQEPCEDTNMRPMSQAYSFQVKVVIKGWCRVRGIVVHAIPMMEPPYEGHRCALLEDSALV